MLTNTYDAYGQVYTSRAGNGPLKTYTIAGTGDLIGVSQEGGANIILNRNWIGWIATTTRAPFGTTTFTRDNWGRIDTVTNPDATSVNIDYDLEDTVTSVTDENNHSNSFVYDDALRLTSTTNGRGDVESYGYNTNGWVTSVTNGRGKTRTYEYTLRGDSWKMTLPDGYFENSSFDGNGNATAYDNNLLRNVLQTIQYNYNQLDQISGINYPNDADVSFTYDGLRRIDTMVDGTGTTDWTYNDRGFLSGLATPQGNLTYTYDNWGRRSTMVDSTGTTTYAYDTYKRPRTVTNPHNETTTWDYDVNGIVIKQTLSTGSKTEYGYDSRGRTTSVVHKKNNNSVISSESYVFDGAGNMTSKTVDMVMTSYGYDYADQLTSESRPGYTATYSYDGNGNRLSKVLNNTITEAYTYDDGDKMLTAGTKSYQYDLAGRTAQVTSPSGVTTVTYDDEDRVARVYNQSQNINQSYRYNGLDTRVQRLDNNSVTRTYRRDGVSPTAPVLADGTATFTPGISERRGGVSKFLHQDYLGSTKQITSSNQTVTDNRKYDAFGLLQTDSTVTTPTAFGFAGGWGYQTDSTGLQLLGHRYYDPSTGRFLTRDPIKDGRNWYGYCDNRASVAIDPEGLNDQPVKVHGNTAGSQQAVLYARYNKHGQFLKWGVTQYVENPNMRYRKFELDGGYCDPVIFGPRNELLRIERELESRMPGVLNNTKIAVRTKNLLGAASTQNAFRMSSRLRGLTKTGAFFGKGFAVLNLYQTGKNLYKAMHSKSCIIDSFGNVYDSSDPEYWEIAYAKGWAN